MRNVYWLILIALIASGCFKKPDQEGMAIQLILPVVPFQGGVVGSYLIAQGACKGDSAVIFSYSSASTPLTTQEVSCSGDYVTTQLPILAGTTSQVFSVSIIGRYQNKKSSAYLTTVNFNPAPSPSAGSTINIAGGQANGASASTWDIVGEWFGVPGTTTGAAAVHRTGLSGVLDP